MIPFHFRGLSTVALATTLLATAAAGTASAERPGVGVTPAFVCVSTTLLPDGRTRDAEITRRSGNGVRDLHALRFVRSVTFKPPIGTTWAALGLGERTGHVLVRIHQNGQMAFKLYEADDALPPICGTPFESVERDREINAQYKEQADA